MSAVQTYNKPDALRQAKKSRKTGWPNAHIESFAGLHENEKQYVIVTHARNCSCSNCPTIRTDGFVD